MKISIVTSTYNRLNKIKLTITSVLKQKYDNWEYYIIDDCSTDKTVEYINSLKDNRIKLITLNKNYGQPGAIFYSNVLKKLSGDLIIFLDSDDYLLDFAFEKIFLDFNNLNFNCDYIAYKFTDKLSIPQISNLQELNLNYYKSKDIFKDNFPLNKNDKGFVDHLFVYSSNYIKKFTISFNDPAFWYVSRYIIHIKNSFDVAFSDTILYFMSFGKDSVTKGNNFIKYAPITLFTRKYIYENFKEYMSNSYYTYALKSYLLNLLIFPNNKKKILNIMFNNFYLLSRYPFFLLFLLIAICIPSRLLYFLKFITKFSRSRR